jgi:hypothetical protein
LTACKDCEAAKIQPSRRDANFSPAQAVNDLPNINRLSEPKRAEQLLYI